MQIVHAQLAHVWTYGNHLQWGLP